jgi:peptidoglycan hydrolase CwlO-like protein
MTTPDNDSTPGNEGAFLLGAAASGVVAVLHNASKDVQHRQEVTDLSKVCNTNYRAWENANSQLKDKTAEVARLQAENARQQDEITRLKADKVRLTAQVDSQAKTIESLEKTYVEPKLRSLLFPPKQDENGGNVQPPN